MQSPEVEEWEALKSEWQKRKSIQNNIIMKGILFGSNALEYLRGAVMHHFWTNLRIGTNVKNVTKTGDDTYIIQFGDSLDKTRVLQQKHLMKHGVNVKPQLTQRQRHIADKIRKRARTERKSDKVEICITTDNWCTGNYQNSFFVGR